jgi:hypothetical protein
VYRPMEGLRPRQRDEEVTGKCKCPFKIIVKGLEGRVTWQVLNREHNHKATPCTAIPFSRRLAEDLATQVIDMARIGIQPKRLLEYVHLRQPGHTILLKDINNLTYRAAREARGGHTATEAAISRMCEQGELFRC